LRTFPRLFTVRLCFRVLRLPPRVPLPFEFVLFPVKFINLLLDGGGADELAKPDVVVGKGADPAPHVVGGGTEGAGAPGFGHTK
jgi:hypothetical protein